MFNCHQCWAILLRLLDILLIGHNNHCFWWETLFFKNNFVVLYLAILWLYFKHRGGKVATTKNNSYQEQVKRRELKFTRTIMVILLNYTVGWAVPMAVWFGFYVR